MLYVIYTSFYIQTTIKVVINISTLASHNFEGTVLHAMENTAYKKVFPERTDIFQY